VIEEHSIIESFVKIKPVCENGSLIIGAYDVINLVCILYKGHGVAIGNNVSIAANCTFSLGNYEYRDRQSLIRNQGFLPSKEGILIEDDVWIGSDCVLLDGATLRLGCVVGAGSIVRRELTEYSVYAGHPLQLIGVRR
jgi:virginiamycin A acetyltransferase